MKNKRNSSMLALLISLTIPLFMYGCKSQAAYLELPTTKTVETKAKPEVKITVNESSKSPEEIKREEELKKLEEQRKLEEQKKLESQRKIEEQKKLDAQQQVQSKAVQANQSIAPTKPTAKTNSTPSTVDTSKQVTSPPQAAPARLIDTIKAKGNSQQVILVQATSYGTYKVTVNTYEKVDGIWKEVLTNIPGVIGRKGFSTNRREGDYTSPVGAFHFPYLFGWGGNAGFKMDYKQSTSDDYWLSLSSLESYNIWFHREGGPDPAWSKSEYEILGPAQKLYKYAAVMDFNMGADKVVGKGSAIFLHIKPASGLGTAGCTAIPEDKLLQVLRWMDPAKNPVIIQGTIADLEGM